MKRLIVTDSTSDLSANMVKGLGIKIIPVNIILDGKSYKDRAQIKIQDFYNNFDRFKAMKTGPVSVDEYSFVFQKLTAQYDEIIFIHCSRHLSRTYENAMTVFKTYEPKLAGQVKIVDSMQCGMGLGLIVLEAAQAFKRGKSFEDTLVLIDRLSKTTITYMTVPTLKYLKANKKISGLKSFFADMLNVKPVLGFDNGKIVVKTKLFGKSENLLLEMVDHINKDIGDSPVTMALVHGRDTRYVKDMITIFNNRFKCKKIYTTYFGPSIVISTGPETMGVAFFKY